VIKITGRAVPCWLPRSRGYKNKKSGPTGTDSQARTVTKAKRDTSFRGLISVWSKGPTA